MNYEITIFANDANNLARVLRYYSDRMHSTKSDIFTLLKSQSFPCFLAPRFFVNVQEGYKII